MYRKLRLPLLIVLLFLPAAAACLYPGLVVRATGFWIGIRTMISCISLLSATATAFLCLTNSRPDTGLRLIGWSYAMASVFLLLHITVSAGSIQFPPKTFLSEAAVLIAVSGMLAAALQPVRRLFPRFKASLPFSSVLSAYGIMLLPAVFARSLEPTCYLLQAYIGWFEYSSAILGLLALFLYSRKKSTANFLNAIRLTLTLFIAGSLADMLYAGQWSPLPGRISQMLAYGPVLLPALWQTTAVRPYKAWQKLAHKYRNSATRAKLQLTQTEGHYKMLLTAAENSAKISTADAKLTDTLDKILKEIDKLLAADHIFISLLEGQQPVFWVVAYKSDFQPNNSPISQKFMINHYLAGEPVIIGDLTPFQPRFRPEIVKAGLTSMLGVPIYYEKELLGVIELFAKKAGAFSQAELAALKIFANQTASAINRTRAAEKSNHTAEALTLLHQIAQTTASHLSPTMLLAKTAEKIGHFLRADAIAAFLVQSGIPPAGVREAFTHGFSKETVQQLKQIMADQQIDFLSQAGRLSPLKNLFSITLNNHRTVHILPLCSSNTLQGFMVFVWNYSRKNSNCAYMESTLSAVSSQIAMGLEKGALYGSVRKFGFTDDLTGLSNRRFFDYILEREVAQVKRYSQPLSLLMIDLDYFKNINDTWGHLTGDIVLKEIGGMLKSAFRQTDITARYGGEEFAVILPQATDQDAFTLAERFRKLVANSVFAADSHGISLTVSIGAATIKPANLDIASATDLILAADQALYRAKQSGRNRTEVWTSTGTLSD